ncbi:unnamed protein product [Aspergillus oryzae RIB40]|uniref:DNA, SC003 n=2 Tax=Aspergillus oryzae TaxID=5062 RepID=Q2UIZ7_ASPOR|nr:unnamed protein product [Aspergillus oryzae RIB40]EIT81623.1 hypothetical protein Ao3042_01897 [Aspergillus oryzae 3.042]KDE76592.1 hypothetical protein AO1008_02401 [Aspergillus oryzae 100-8]BAE58468.1 unnamed protein product [Aspergillus oryzae RIB40]|eukprot:EIT81623.1 hypothetical protein Ao3042_01897 [Aspergillus oryzae 3.042]
MRSNVAMKPELDHAADPDTIVDCALWNAVGIRLYFRDKFDQPMRDNERAPKEHPWKVSYCVARHSFRVEDLFSRTSAIGEGVLYSVPTGAIASTLAELSPR